MYLSLLSEKFSPLPVFDLDFIVRWLFKQLRNCKGFPDLLFVIYKKLKYTYIYIDIYADIYACITIANTKQQRGVTSYHFKKCWNTAVDP